MITGLLAILADALRFHRHRPVCEPLQWDAERAKAAGARAEAAQRWTWAEWLDEFGCDTWTDTERENVA